MGKGEIKIISHVTVSATLSSWDRLNPQIMEHVKKIQKEGLEVEIQYQQSDLVVSALIIGREKANG